MLRGPPKQLPPPAGGCGAGHGQICSSPSTLPYQAREARGRQKVRPKQSIAYPRYFNRLRRRPSTHLKLHEVAEGMFGGGARRSHRPIRVIAPRSSTRRLPPADGVGGNRKCSEDRPNNYRHQREGVVQGTGKDAVRHQRYPINQGTRGAGKKYARNSRSPTPAPDISIGYVGGLQPT